MSLRSSRNGCLYSERALARWPITWRIAFAYGREARIRSCALRIFEAETISSARVTLRVLPTLLILVRISRAPAIFYSLAIACSGTEIGDRRSGQELRSPPRISDLRSPISLLPRTGLLEFLDALLQRRLDRVVP